MRGALSLLCATRWPRGGWRSGETPPKAPRWGVPRALGRSPGLLTVGRCWRGQGRWGAKPHGVGGQSPTVLGGAAQAATLFPYFFFT